VTVTEREKKIMCQVLLITSCEDVSNRMPFYFEFSPHMILYTNGSQITGHRLPVIFFLIFQKIRLAMNLSCYEYQQADIYYEVSMSTGAAPPERRNAGFAASPDGKLYMFGGFAMNGCGKVGPEG
jgi:hypothetical protein